MTHAIKRIPLGSPDANLMNTSENVRPLRQRLRDNRLWLSPAMAFALLIAVLAGSGAAAYWIAQQKVMEGVQRELAAVAHLKAEQIESWLLERHHDAEIIAGTPLFVESLRTWIEGGRRDDAHAEMLQDHLREAAAKSRLRNACLRSAADGRPLMKADCHRDTPELAARAMAAAGSPKPLLEDFHAYEGNATTVEFGLFAPVRAEGSQRAMAVAHFTWEPTDSLFPALQQWPGASASAETLLVRREGDEVVFLNKIRYRAEAPLQMRWPLADTQLMAVQAALGKTGFATGHDYRHVPTVGNLQAVPGTPWFLITKMDAAEAKSWLQVLAGVIATAIVLLLALTVQWWRVHHRNEARLNEAQRLARIGSWELNLPKNVLTWSDEEYLIFGMPPEEFGASYEAFLDTVHPDDRELVNQAYTRSVTNRQPYDIEHRLRLKDGSIRYVNERCETFYDRQGRPLRSIGTTQDITERKALERERELQSERLAKMAARLVSVQENERRHLSAELHDRTSSNLATLGILLQSLEKALPGELQGNIDALLDDVRALIEDTNVSIREICADLRPAILDHAGLLPALENYAETFANRTGIEARVDCSGVPSRLSPDIESRLFRIAQESLTNCAKHAQASSVVITLSHRDREVSLDIADDGIGIAGFDGRDGMPPGLGLLTMRERAEFGGGSFRIDSRPGQGTRIGVTIPLP